MQIQPPTRHHLHPSQIGTDSPVLVRAGSTRHPHTEAGSVTWCHWLGKRMSIFLAKFTTCLPFNPARVFLDPCKEEASSAGFHFSVSVARPRPGGDVFQGPRPAAPPCASGCFRDFLPCEHPPRRSVLVQFGILKSRAKVTAKAFDTCTISVFLGCVRIALRVPNVCVTLSARQVTIARDGFSSLQ